MPEIKNIILDFGGVILDIDFDKTHQAFHKLGVNGISDQLRKELFNFEAGLSDAQSLFSAFRTESDKTISDEDINHAWCQLLRDLPQYRIDYLSALGEKYPLYLLSNTNGLHIDYLRQRENSKFSQFENAFDKVFYSHEMQSRKPDSEIFLKMIDDIKIKPNETLFVDDLADNIETADKLGFQTWLFDVEKHDITKLLEQNYHFNAVYL